MAGEIDGITLVYSCVVVLLTFISTNKVFSPQYLIWLLPFVPLLRVRHAILLSIICGLTNLNFYSIYDSLVALQPVAVLMLNLRNMLIIALLLWLLQCDPASVTLGKSLFNSGGCSSDTKPYSNPQ
jgi:membrane-associated phospholipid phosphatase